MMRWLTFLITLLLTHGAHAQFNGCPPGLCNKWATAAPYIGPGDIVGGAIAWFGLRGYSAAYAATGTGKALNIRRASDNATTDVVILTSGELDVATATTFCAATTCFITKIYDQSGANKCSSAPCDAIQVTSARQPQLLLTGGTSSGKPYIKFVRANSQMLVSGGPSATSQPYTMSAVAIRNGSFTSYQSIVGASNATIMFMNLTNAVGEWSGVASPTIAAADSAWHAINAIIAYGTGHGVIYVDGSNATGNPSTGVLGTGFIGISFTNFIEGGVEEAGVWNVGFSGAQAASMNTNQHTYWGF